MAEDGKDCLWVKLPAGDYFDEVVGKKKVFPKYTTQLINIANQNAQATRPPVVGQMSELIKQCPEKSFKGWKEWYLERHPEAIDRAGKKIMPMIKKMRDAIESIDDDMVRDWVEELVLVKTAEGLIIQEIILRYIADKKGEEWRLASAEEEHKGIDGYVGGRPIQIKPDTYKSKKSSVRENIDVEIVYYKKTSKCLYVQTDLI